MEIKCPQCGFDNVEKTNGPISAGFALFFGSGILFLIGIILPILFVPGILAICISAILILRGIAARPAKGFHYWKCNRCKSVFTAKFPLGQ